MAQLSVNVNKVATLRNTRHLNVPDVARMARLALEAGAAGITIHPRPDQRHIRPEDVDAIALVVTDHDGTELNIEGNPFHGLIGFARRVSPTQVTLVPDEESAFTSQEGWDLDKDGTRLEPVIDQFRNLGSRVSLFLDPKPELVPLAANLGADRIELYTEPYARSFGTREEANLIEAYRQTAIAALEHGLGVNAGHDLNLVNLTPFLGRVPGVLEVSIGHALIADALEFGLEATVQQYLSACCVLSSDPAKLTPTA